AIADALRSGFGQYKDATGRLVCCFVPDLFYYYIENITELHDRVVVQQVTCSPLPLLPTGASEQPPANLAANAVPLEKPRNRVIYGAPGTGKSHLLNGEANQYFPDPWLRTRVTFYPDYSHSQFFGSFKPSPIYRLTTNDLFEGDRNTPIADRKEPLIDYRFVA